MYRIECHNAKRVLQQSWVYNPSTVFSDSVEFEERLDETVLNRDQKNINENNCEFFLRRSACSVPSSPSSSKEITMLEAQESSLIEITNREE